VRPHSARMSTHALSLPGRVRVRLRVRVRVRARVRVRVRVRVRGSSWPAVAWRGLKHGASHG